MIKIKLASILSLKPPRCKTIPKFFLFIIIVIITISIIAVIANIY